MTDVVKHRMPGRTPGEKKYKAPSSPDSGRSKDLPDESRMDGRIVLACRPYGNLHTRALHAFHQIGSKGIEAEEDEELKKGG